MNPLGQQLRRLIVDAVRRGDVRSASNCQKCSGCGEVTRDEVVESYHWREGERWQRVKSYKRPCLDCSGSGLVAEKHREPDPERYCFGESLSRLRRVT